MNLSKKARRYQMPLECVLMICDRILTKEERLYVLMKLVRHEYEKDYVWATFQETYEEHYFYIFHVLDKIQELYPKKAQKIASEINF